MPMKNKTLCLCMIVKDEAHIILETLESVKRYLDYWVICDTGSTDNTISLIQDFFAKEKIPGELHSETWVDFGHNRSQVFTYAYQKADYLWVMDADDILVGDFDVHQLSEADSYALRYGTDFIYWRPQLFNGFEKWCYKGVLHEYAFCLSKPEQRQEFIDGSYHIVSRRLGARNLINPTVKYLLDAQAMERALQQESDFYLTTRYLFYIAQSYRDAGQPALAIQWYEKRIAAGGWAEEVWFSKYQIGLLYEQLGNTKEAKICYLNAYEYRPTRAESLYSLGKMCNLQQEFCQAHMFLSVALKIPPPSDLLFVSQDFYRYLIAFELSISAYWIADFEWSVFLCNQLIQMKDQIPLAIVEQTEKNKAFGLEKLALGNKS
jgi:glycosyltransferase involved in cell wall biosynthesis